MLDVSAAQRLAATEPKQHRSARDQRKGTGSGGDDGTRTRGLLLAKPDWGGRHLRSWGAAQVEGAVALSVVVRSGPVMTAVNARSWHGRGQPWYACRCWVHLDHRVRAVRGNHGCMGKPLQTARQLFRMPSGRGRMGRWLRRSASMPTELGSSRPGSTGGSTCRFSRRPRLGTLSRHLYCGHFDARRGKGSASLHSMDAAGRCHIRLLPIRT